MKHGERSDVGEQDLPSIYLSTSDNAQVQRSPYTTHSQNLAWRLKEYILHVKLCASRADRTSLLAGIQVTKTCDVVIVADALCL